MPFRLPSDSVGSRGPREDFLHNFCGELLLHGDAVWTEECEGYVPTDGYTHVQGTDRQKIGGLY